MKEKAYRFLSSEISKRDWLFIFIINIVHTLKNVYPLICDYRNAEYAYQQTRRNRRYNYNFLEFEMNRHVHLARIVESLQDKSYQIGDYTYAIIHDYSKERRIMILPVEDRIVQHMWDNFVNSYIDRSMYYHSYSSRVGKGLHAAISTLGNWLHIEWDIKHNEVWAIKGDIRKFFDSVDHNILKCEMRRYIGDKDLLWLIDNTIDHNGKYLPHGKGIPIGNVSSQLFANVYLNVLDYYIKQELHVNRYIRYADDFIILGNDYHHLQYLLYEKIIPFLTNTLLLDLNPKSDVLYAGNGIPYLGFIIYHDHIIPKPAIVRRIEHHIRNLYNGKENINENHYIESFYSRRGFIKHVDTYQMIKAFEREIEDYILFEDIK